MAPYHRLEQDIDWEEEAEQLRLEGFTSNDLEPEVEPEPAPARAPAPAPASSLVQGTLLGNAATASMDRRDRVAAAVLAAGPITKPKQATLFFHNVSSTKASSQNVRGDCVFCGETRASSGATRFIEHLLICNLAPRNIKQGFRALTEKKCEKQAEKRMRETLRAEENELDAQAHNLEQESKRQQGIKAGLKTAAHNAADIAIANWFYANAIPFAVAGSTADGLWHNMINKIKQSPSNYIPPGAKKLAGPLLDEAYAQMLKKLATRDPDGLIKEKFCATYNTDGWDSTDHLPLINSTFVVANDGGRFWRSVDTSGHEKNTHYCAKLMIEDIYEFGCSDVVLICTDTCNVMKACWDKVMEEFPWISVLPCQPHVISLLLKDIAKDEAVSKVIKEEGLLVSWFSNHHLPLAILRSHARNKFGKTMALIKAAATRFGTNTLVGERLLQLRGCLQGTVVDEQYVKQNYKDAPGDAEEGGKGATAKRYAPPPARRQAAESQQTQTPDPNRKQRSDTPPTTHLFVCEHWHTPGSTAPAPRRLKACAGR
jgi:hypothetical protein